MSCAKEIKLGAAMRLTLYRKSLQTPVDLTQFTITGSIYHPKLGSHPMQVIVAPDGSQAKFFLPGSATAMMMPGEYYWECTMVRNSDGFVEKYPKNNSVMFKFIRGA